VKEKKSSHRTVSCNDQQSWNPFLWCDMDEISSVLDSMYTCKDQKRQKITTQLCHHIIRSEFMDITCLTDMLCSTILSEYHHVNELFMVYCQMCIGTTSECLLMTVFDLDEEEKVAFSKAC